MNLPLPNLDDRTYDDIVKDAVAQIPIEYPKWTDHNPTDTGIILIELLAWLTEMTLYQVNQIPDENYVEFLNLLRGEQLTPLLGTATEKHENLQLAIQQTLLELRQRYRAVTAEDYEKLVLEDWNQSQAASDYQIARVKCLPQRNLDNFDADTFADGHISLVVVPETVSEPDGLVFYYPLDRIITKTDATSEVIDRSANKLNGTVMGSAQIVSDSEMGKCLSFDGDDDYIKLPAINFDYSQGLTISVWVNFDSFSDCMGIIDLGQGYQSNQISLINQPETNNLSFYIYKGSESYRIRSISLLEENKWLNIAVTVEYEGTGKIYKDSNKALEETIPIPKMVERTSNIIGNNNWSLNNHNFKGKMARLRMYNRALSEAEINQTLEQDQTEISSQTKLFNFLEERKLLTTRLHIVQPDYIPLAITTELMINDGAQPEDVQESAAAEVAMFFDPVDSGKYWQGQGYPFGRSIYPSEIYKLLDDLPGVDYVQTLLINEEEEEVEINLKDNQLVVFQLENSTFTILVKVGNDIKSI